jgi:hypothetical protein
MAFEAEEEKALVEVLAALVRDYGPSQLVDAVLLTPDSTSYPDWSPDMDGADELAHCIFEHAGLGALEIELRAADLDVGVTSRAASAGGDDRIEEIHDPTGPAMLLELGPSDCAIAVDLSDPSDPSMLAAALCRAAGIALVAGRQPSYREMARVEIAPSEEVLRRAGVATIHLGLGIITTNDAYRFYRKEGKRQIHRMAGILDYEELAFLLAVQWVARGSNAHERARIAGALHPNQQGAFNAFTHAIDADAIRERLGLRG